MTFRARTSEYLHELAKATRLGHVVALNFNGLRLDPDSEAPDFLKAVVATIANDDVIEHLHAEQRAGINEATRQLNVVRAGGRIAAGMIVRQDDRRGVCEQRHLEHLAWLCCGRSYVAQPPEGQRGGGLTVHGRNIMVLHCFEYSP